MNQKKNKQYLETDKRIQEALLMLLKEKKTPTVAQICRLCNINRTTFYLHYVDIVELMEVLKKDINKEFTQSTYDYDGEVTLMSYSSYLLFAKHVKKNIDFFRFFFKVSTSFPLKDGFEEMWEPILVPYFKEKGIDDERIMQLRFVAFQAGFTHTLGKWVENDCDLDCEDVAKILCECITL